MEKVSKTLLANADMMRAMAHPLRMSIVGSLRLDGPATSAMLARRLDTDSGQTSHHLRLLARHGFVEEAPELGRGARGRERWWKAAHDATEWSEPGPGGEEVVRAVNRAARAVWDREIEVFHADAARQRWSAEWQKAAESSDQVIRTTPARLALLQAEIERLVRESDLADADLPDAAKVLVIWHTYPHRPA